MLHKRILISIIAIILSSTAIHVMATEPKVIYKIKKLTSSDETENDRFGYSVAIDGDTLAIAAYLERD